MGIPWGSSTRGYTEVGRKETATYSTEGGGSRHDNSARGQHASRLDVKNLAYSYLQLEQAHQRRKRRTFGVPSRHLFGQALNKENLIPRPSDKPAHRQKPPYPSSAIVLGAARSRRKRLPPLQNSKRRQAFQDYAQRARGTAHTIRAVFKRAAEATAKSVAAF